MIDGYASIAKRFCHFHHPLTMHVTYMMKLKKLCRLGAGTISPIQARLSGINIYYARTSKLVLDFLSVELSLVTNSAHAAHVPARLQLAGPECELKTVRGTKNPKPVLKVLHNKYSFLRVSP